MDANIPITIQSLKQSHREHREKEIAKRQHDLECAIDNSLGAAKSEVLITQGYRDDVIISAPGHREITAEVEFGVDGMKLGSFRLGRGSKQYATFAAALCAAEIVPNKGWFGWFWNIFET